MTSSNCYSVAVQLEEIIYMASQCPALPWNSFMPHEFVEGGDVQVRIEKNKLVLQRPNGKELKARIMKRVKKRASRPDMPDGSQDPLPTADRAARATAAPDSLTVLGVK